MFEASWMDEGTQPVESMDLHNWREWSATQAAMDAAPPLPEDTIVVTTTPWEA